MREKKKFSYWPKFCTLPLDLEFLSLVLMLTVIGLIMLLSVSYPAALHYKNDALFYFKRQSVFALIGIAAMVFISFLDYEWLRKVGRIFLIFSLILLVLVLVPSIGEVKYNARRWISIGNFSFQPSEIVKLSVIVAFSASISVKKEKMRRFKTGIAPYASVLALIFALMMKEPHLSGAILITAVGCTLMYVGGIRRRWVIAALCVVCLGLYLLLSGTVSYGQSRIAMWRDPFIDASDEGYQLSQSIIAIGSGGIWGLGLGRSRQKFLYLPEVQNDFVFSIVAEELGLVGACLILTIFALLIIRGYLIARNSKDRFGALLCVGVITQFALQTFLNVAVVTGLVPTTGISLPFFSYGGTALVMQLAEMGIVLSVSRQERENYYMEEKGNVKQI
jgi:cell division protein FtsW